jgi:hypothetical protein
LIEDRGRRLEAGGKIVLTLSAAILERSAPRS